MFYICRNRRAEGIATQIIEAQDFDEFLTKGAGLEPLAAFHDQDSVRRFFVNQEMYSLMVKVGGGTYPQPKILEPYNYLGNA